MCASVCQYKSTKYESIGRFMGKQLLTCEDATANSILQMKRIKFTLNFPFAV